MEEVGGYTLGERLGAGSGSRVYLAHPSERPDLLVAVKRLAAASSPEALTDLHREAEVLERLSHPSIVRLFDAVDDDGRIALIIPYLAGGSLADRLRSGQPLEPVAVADLGARVGSALAAAHGAGVLHRDVKPANILFDTDGQPLLTDFGVASARVAVETDESEVPGTAEYLDPALLSGHEPGPESDVYALGVTCFEALAGQPPYAAASPEATVRAAERGVRAPLEQLAPNAPASLVAAIERALAPDPDARFAAAHEFAGRCEEVRIELERDGGPAVPPDRPPGSPRPPSDPAGPPPVPTSSPAATGSSRRTPELPTHHGADGGRSGTRTFGPRPPTVEPGPAPDRRRRPWLLAAAAAVLLVPLVVVAVLVLPGEPDDEVPADDPAETPAAEAEPRDPAPCPGVEVDDPEQGEVLLADLDDEGCARPVVWDDNVLTVEGEDGEVVRYELGQDGDELVMGDWDCDDRDTPALYRPSTGEVFEFPGFAGDDGGLESDPARDPETTEGTPEVERPAGGCDEVVVTPPH